MPKTRTASAGRCRLCGAKFSKSAMTTHLKACLQRVPEGTGRRKPPSKPVAAVHLLVDGGRYLGMYWMHVLVRGNAELVDLDDFLRGIWLECCGHMSQFTIGGRNFTGNPEWTEDESMDVSVSKAVSGAVSFGYEYDFGSTTALSMRVLGTLPYPMGRDKVQLLARNDPPKEVCQECGKPAVLVCSYCMNESPAPFFCEACGDKHGCGEEAFLPVVNSPRCGVCGYVGRIAADQDEDAD